MTDSGGGNTTYEYDAYGNLLKLKDPTCWPNVSPCNITTYTYDLRGRKTQAIDPDMGVWNYVYNVLDELISQTDAKSQNSNLTYDTLGRVTSRTETGLSSSWTYGTSAAAKNVGKLTQATTSAGYARNLTYDSLGRPATTQLTIGGANYTYSSAYDTNGRLDTVTYPSSFAAKYVYTNLGYLSQLKDAVGGFVFWTANAMNAEGQLTQQTAGNGIVTTRAFDPLTGRLAGVTAGSGNSVANMGFSYDVLGNLTARTDSLSFGSETFGYDTLNRLTSAQVSGQTLHGVSYNAIGNILTKTRLDNNALANTYSYNATGQARPHAVASVAGLVNGVLNPVYTYDLDGNLTSGAGRTVTWTSFNMVATIVQGATTMSYAYDSEHARITQTETNGANTTTTTYLNDPASGISSEKVVAGSTTTWTDYLFAGGARVAQRSMVVGGATTLRYFITDHLGSIAVITDGAGVVLERLAYDAWGKRRNTNGTDDPAGSITSSVTRGFTDHEMIASVGLVNMNGRVYDPELGRFLSADPIVPSIFFSQALNRFSYVYNQPLSLTDPSGHGTAPDIVITGTREIVITANRIPNLRLLNEGGGVTRPGGGFGGGAAGNPAPPGEISPPIRSVVVNVKVKIMLTGSRIPWTVTLSFGVPIGDAMGNSLGEDTDAAAYTSGDQPTHETDQKNSTVENWIIGLELGIWPVNGQNIPQNYLDSYDWVRARARDSVRLGNRGAPGAREFVSRWQKRGPWDIKSKKDDEWFGFSYTVRERLGNYIFGYTAAAWYQGFAGTGNAVLTRDIGLDVLQRLAGVAQFVENGHWYSDPLGRCHGDDCRDQSLIGSGYRAYFASDNFFDNVLDAGF